jgi:hypothetical protein
MVVSLRKESEQSPEAALDVMARLLEQLRKAKAEV